MPIQKAAIEDRGGYRVEDWTYSPEMYTVRVTVNEQGDYIGTIEDAAYLIEQRGIAPETRTGAEVCTIGYCEKEKKWYGWSHRAISGFGIGYTIERDTVIEHLGVGRVIASLEEAKQIAEAFAEAVS